MDADAAVTGVVLAGGKSRRLGRPKALERVGGQALISRVCQRLAQVCDGLVVVVAADTDVAALALPPGTQVVRDLYPDSGSLGGIYTGVEAARHPWALVVACDMPFLSVPLLRHLAMLRTGHDVVAPVIGGFPEPTHALYAKACLGPMRQRLEQRRLKITGFYDAVRVAYVTEEEARRHDPELRSFMNTNTQEDLDRALALAAEAERT